MKATVSGKANERCELAEFTELRALLHLEEFFRGRRMGSGGSAPSWDGGGASVATESSPRGAGAVGTDS